MNEDDFLKNFAEELNNLPIEYLEISPDEFSDEERRNAEDWCREFKPYRCQWCHSMTMLDRGKKFQCQLCSTEYECDIESRWLPENQEKFQEWRKKIKKIIMSSIY